MNLFLLIIGVFSAVSDVVTTRVDNEYRVVLTGKDLDSFKKVMPEFKNISISIQKDKESPTPVFSAELDPKSSEYGSFVFGSLDRKDYLEDEKSPYRRLSKSDFSNRTSSRIRLYVSNNDKPEISEFYDELLIDEVVRNSKRDKTWLSEDKSLKIFCTRYLIPIVSTHTCAFSLVEP